MEMRHASWAIKAAEVITNDRYDGSRRISTAYGEKTTLGIADLIVRCQQETIEVVQLDPQLYRDIVETLEEFRKMALEAPNSSYEDLTVGYESIAYGATWLIDKCPKLEE